MPWVALDYAQRELKVANGGSGVCGGGSHKSDDAACVAVLLLLCRLVHLPALLPCHVLPCNPELVERGIQCGGHPHAGSHRPQNRCVLRFITETLLLIALFTE